MSSLEELLEQSAAKVAEYQLRADQLQQELENKLEEAKAAYKDAEKLQQQAIQTKKIFAPPGYIILTTSSNYGDHNPYISWFPTLEDAELYRKWCNTTGDEWIEPIRDGKKIMSLSEWVLSELEDWEKPEGESPTGKAAILEDLRKNKKQ